jgi:hypothetical protein
LRPIKAHGKKQEGEESMPHDVTEILIDGTSGIAPGGVEGSGLVVGVCSLGTPGKAYLVGKSTDLAATFGVGPLVDRLMDLFMAAGQDPVVVAVPVSGSGGDVGAVAHTGDGPTITTGGTPLAAADVIIEIMSSGGLNEGTYRLSIDGGDSYGLTRTIPADGAIAIGTTGVTATVPGSPDAVAGETYSFSITEPVPSISAVMTAIEGPLELYDVEFVYVVGASDATDWAAMGAQADVLWNRHQPTFFLAESALPGDGDDLDDWTTAMLAEREGFAHRFVVVCAAFGEVSDYTGKRLTRNWAGLLAGRIIGIPVMRAVGRTKDGGISQGALPDGYNDSRYAALTGAAFVAAKTYAGMESPYWGDSRTMAEDNSDFRNIEVLRTVFKAVRKARLAALRSMFDEAGDPVLEGGASGLLYLKTSIESALNALKRAVPPELAGFKVKIPPGQDIVNNGVSVEMTLIGIPIIREIKILANYVYAGTALDPRLEA